MKSKLNQIERDLLKTCLLLSYCSVHTLENLSFCLGTGYTNDCNSSFCQGRSGYMFFTRAASRGTDLEIAACLFALFLKNFFIQQVISYQFYIY